MSSAPQYHAIWKKGKRGGGGGWRCKIEREERTPIPCHPRLYVGRGGSEAFAIGRRNTAYFQNAVRAMVFIIQKRGGRTGMACNNLGQLKRGKNQLRKKKGGDQSLSNLPFSGRRPGKGEGDISREKGKRKKRRRAPTLICA